MHSKLEEFAERIMAITPQYIDIFGRGLPGMAGGSAAISGATNSAADVTLQLKRETAQFVRLYTGAKATHDELLAQAKRIEGCLLGEQTLGTLNQKQTNRLVKELFDLIEKR